MYLNSYDLLTSVILSDIYPSKVLFLKVRNRCVHILMSKSTDERANLIATLSVNKKHFWLNNRVIILASFVSNTHLRYAALSIYTE